MQELRERCSFRLPGYDYSSTGAYFVTLCSDRKELLFADVCDDGLRLKDAGEIIREEWLKTAHIRKNIRLDEFVIMPNHFHAIIWIVNASVGATRWVAPTRTLRADSLGSIIGQFKSIVTKRVGYPVWQRNYYERIIRNEAELDRIRQYILDNPRNWMDDPERP